MLGAYLGTVQVGFSAQFRQNASLYDVFHFRALLGSGEESLGDAEQREGPERMPGSRRGREEPAGSEIEEQTKEAEEGREAN